MLKIKKHALGASALAVALAATLCAPALAFAADPAPPDNQTRWGANGTSTSETPATPEIKAADATSSTVVTGQIKATSLKVTVPTKITFWIDPGATPVATKPTNLATNAKIGQFTNPKNFTIKNYSAVDVYGYVTSVSAANATLVNAPANVDKTTGTPTATNNKVMVGIADVSTDLAFDKTTDWLATTVADAKPYFAFNNNATKELRGKLAASADGSTVGGSATMTIRGQVDNAGWAENELFTVTPVFKVVTTANASTTPSNPTT